MAMQTAPQFQSSAPISGSQHLELEAPVAAHLVGVNSSWRKLLLQAEIVAPHLHLATIEGENGSGKQTFARFLHSRSKLAKSAFQRHDAREWLVTEADPTMLAGFIYLDRVDLLASTRSRAATRCVEGDAGSSAGSRRSIGFFGKLFAANGGARPLDARSCFPIDRCALCHSAAQNAS
ncbi:MAG: sigma 54-interacting transcriptional regulator [Terracidiphilus sp.]